MRLKIVQAANRLAAQARQLTREEIISDEIQRLIGTCTRRCGTLRVSGSRGRRWVMALQTRGDEDREELLSSLPAQELAEKERQAVAIPRHYQSRDHLLGDDGADFYEGCLSWLDFSPSCGEPAGCGAYLNEHGEPQLSKLLDGTRILQHEIDHLRGTGCTSNRMETRTFTSLDNWSRFWKGKPVRTSSKH